MVKHGDGCISKRKDGRYTGAFCGTVTTCKDEKSAKAKLKELKARREYNILPKYRMYSNWIEKKIEISDKSEIRCKNCNREVVWQIVDNKYKYENFCPHCGAMMIKK